MRDSAIPDVFVGARNLPRAFLEKCGIFCGGFFWQLVKSDMFLMAFSSSAVLRSMLPSNGTRQLLVETGESEKTRPAAISLTFPSHES